MPKDGIIVEPGKEVDPPLKVDEIKQARLYLTQLKKDVDKIDKLLAKVQAAMNPPKAKKARRVSA